MKRIALTTALALTIVFAGLAQNNPKGPAAKNAKPGEKYDGNTSVLVKEEPRQFQGPEYKNLNRGNYKIEVLDTRTKMMPNDDLVVSTKNTIYESLPDTETIIYRRVETKDMEGVNTQKLKGPKYKNRRPGN